VIHIILFQASLSSVSRKSPNRPKGRLIHRSETQVIVQVPSKLKLVLNVTKLSIPILIKPRMFARRVICEVDKRVRCGTSYRKLVVHAPISALSLSHEPSFYQLLDVISLSQKPTRKILYNSAQIKYLLPKANIKNFRSKCNEVN